MEDDNMPLAVLDMQPRGDELALMQRLSAGFSVLAVVPHPTLHAHTFSHFCRTATRCWWTSLTPRRGARLRGGSVRRISRHRQPGRTSRGARQTWWPLS